MTKTRFIALVPKSIFKKVTLFSVEDRDFEDAYEVIFNSLREDIRNSKIDFISVRAEDDNDALLQIQEAYGRKRKPRAKWYDLSREVPFYV